MGVHGRLRVQRRSHVVGKMMGERDVVLERQKVPVDHKGRLYIYTYLDTSEFVSLFPWVDGVHT